MSEWTKQEGEATMVPTYETEDDVPVEALHEQAAPDETPVVHIQNPADGGESGLFAIEE